MALLPIAPAEACWRSALTGETLLMMTGIYDSTFIS